MRRRVAARAHRGNAGIPARIPAHAFLGEVARTKRGAVIASPLTLDGGRTRRLAVLLVLLQRPVCAASDAAAAATPTDAHAIVDSVLRADGSHDALDRVRAYRLEGDMFSAMRHASAPIVRVFARPDRFKVLIDYPDAPEGRLLDHDRGWRNEHGGALEPAAGPMLSAMVLQATRADVPWILEERASSCHVIPGIEHDGVQLLGIEVPLGGGLMFRAFVHPVTHLVVVSQGAIEKGEMRTHFETIYSDFRAVEGVTFAFHEENWASGMQTGVTTVKRVMINPKLHEDAFRPPGAAKDSARAGGD